MTHETSQKYIFLKVVMAVNVHRSSGQTGEEKFTSFHGRSGDGDVQWSRIIDTSFCEQRIHGNEAVRVVSQSEIPVPCLASVDKSRSSTGQTG